MYKPVKQAETSSESREVSVGLEGWETGCLLVVGVAADLAIDIFVLWVWRWAAGREWMAERNIPIRHPPRRFMAALISTPP
jgi:hypothetical protein